MRVDETRHHRHTGAVDDVSIAGVVDDLAVTHEDVALLSGNAVGVENPAAAEVQRASQPSDTR